MRKLAQTAFVFGVLITLYQALTRRRPVTRIGRDDFDGPLLH